MSPEEPSSGPARAPAVSIAFLEIAAAALVLFWRAWILRLPELVEDFVAFGAAYWIFTRFAVRTRAWRPVTFLVMSWLLFVYARGQTPQTIALLGMGR